MTGSALGHARSHGWLHSWTRKLPALLLSGAPFAGIHAEFDGMNVVLAFVLGLLAAWDV